MVDSYDIDDKLADFIEEMRLGALGAVAIILTDKVTVDIVNIAAQAGVKQVLDIGVSSSEFCEKVEALVTKERQMNAGTTSEKKTRSTVYGFFSGKGGVGKTTLAVNVAEVLANRGKNTLLIDLDLQFGDADMALDIEPTSTIIDLARDTHGVSIDNLNQTCATKGALSVLCSPGSPELAEYVTSKSVKSIIDVARNHYEYILIDCGCALTDPVITSLENSDIIFMVNDVNILSLKRAKLSMNVMSQLGQQDKARLVINKNEKKNAIQIEEFEKLLGIPAYAIISSDFKSVNASLNNGQPVTEYKPRAAISKDIFTMVDKMVMDREGHIDEPKKAKRFSK